MLDFIIVGQGIAGSMLSWFLMKEGQQVLFIDEFNGSSATHVASGITNPITGRKFVKTWLADELIPFSQATFRQFEELFHQLVYLVGIFLYRGQLFGSRYPEGTHMVVVYQRIVQGVLLVVPFQDGLF